MGVPVPGVAFTGGFYGSVQVRRADGAAVKSAAEAVAKEKSIRCLVGPSIGGWTGTYTENHGLDGGIGAALAVKIGCDVLQLIVHDDDLLAYRLWRDHQLVDSYWSKPGYSGEDNRAEEEASSGNVRGRKLMEDSKGLGAKDQNPNLLLPSNRYV